jgi:hypothetical protein
LRTGNRKARALRQNVNAALSLGELLQEFEAVSVPRRFRDGSELGEQGLFRTLA